MQLVINKNRPYGIVSPPENEAHFWQDGFYFDVNGVAIERMMDEAAKARLEEMEAERVAREAADEARRRWREERFGKSAKADGATEPAMAAPPAPPVEDEAADPDDVDLVGWLTGQKKYQFFSIKGAIKSKYGKQVADKRGAIDFLVEELGLVHEEQVAA